MDTSSLTPEGDAPKNIMKGMRIFCIALMIGCLLFSTIVIVMSSLSVIAISMDKNASLYGLITLIVLATICLFMALRNYNNSITSAKDSLNTLPEKLNEYRPTLIKYMALCEGPALFGIILFFISGNYYSLIITGVMLIAMLAKFPTLTRVVTDLGLSSQEQIELE